MPGMLEALLQELQRGGALEVNALAAHLKTTPQMVSAMLEYLQRAGMIHEVEACAAACNDCKIKSACEASPHKQGARPRKQGARLLQFKGR